METHPLSDLCALLTFAFHSTLSQRKQHVFLDFHPLKDSTVISSYEESIHFLDPYGTF